MNAKRINWSPPTLRAVANRPQKTRKGKTGRNAARSIGYDDKEATASNLRRIYGTKRKDLNLTQKKLTKILGCSQSAVSQQLNGLIGLNNQQKRQWADALEVAVSEIDDALVDQDGYAITDTPVKQVSIPLMYALLNNTPVAPTEKTVAVMSTTAQPHVFGIEIQSTPTALEGVVEPGDTVLVNPAKAVRQGSRVAVFLLDGKIAFGRYLHWTSDALLLSAFVRGGVETTVPRNKVRVMYAIDGFTTAG